jgi:bacterioferritin-associated ferredoxin|tara:strand:- start:427 stop:627 length:201 start_codon:yes stop_codon:yes gene_type:complete
MGFSNEAISRIVEHIAKGETGVIRDYKMVIAMLTTVSSDCENCAVKHERILRKEVERIQEKLSEEK